MEAPPPSGRRAARAEADPDLGPGLIAGASDDDPGSIATCSQVGAEFGYGLAWPIGLARTCRAKAFYGTIAAATCRSAALNFTPIEPIKALLWSAVVNGVVAAPVMAMMMHLTTQRDAMGDFMLPMALASSAGWRRP